MEAVGASSPHRLVVFLTALGRCRTSHELIQVAAEVLAEEFDAEVGIVVIDDSAGASVGFGSQPHLAASLVATRPGTAMADVPGVGPCHTMAAAWSADGTGRLVVARTSAPFTIPDRDLLLGMAGAFALAADANTALDRERARLKTLEVLLAIQRSISHRAPLKEILEAITAGASELLRGCPVALDITDGLDPEVPLRVGDQVGDGDHGFAAPVHIQGSPAGLLRAVPDDGSSLGAEDRALLSSFAEHASLALTDAATMVAMNEAFHDPLTGLPNRPLFIDRLAEALRTEEEAPLAVLFVDLDRFKAVNDTMGHAAGDELLVQVAKRIRSATRMDSSAARFGGDEFALMVRHGGEEAYAVEMAERIIAAMAEPFVVRGKNVAVGATVGIAHSGGGRAATELLADADLAMYRAKAVGGGRHATFVPRMRHELTERLDFEAALRGALHRREFFVEFQPIVDLVSGAPVAFESLLRWRSGERGLVPPAEVIPVAEATGLIVPIGRWVLEHSCERLAQWRRTLPDLRVSVNVSVHQLRHEGFVGDLQRITSRHGVPSSALIIEVTESAIIEDSDDTVATLHALAALGFAVALDDFGTGFSSLGYLQRFPVDVLKIDRSFVSGGHDEKSDQLVRTIIELGRAYGIDVIAEGIETSAQLKSLVREGCRLGQGFYLGRPEPGDAVYARLRQRTDALAGEV